MRTSMKKWMAYLFVAFLLLGVFPLLSTSTGAQEGDARADEIGIKGISIVNATNVSIDATPDGVIILGNWNILVDYNLTENMDLWVLYNISSVDSTAYTRSNFTLGNVVLGEDKACNNGTFNFAAGEYWVNVTIGNESGPSVNTTYGELFEFGDVSEVEVTDVGIMGFTDTVNGYYANESHEIVIDTDNMGNLNLTQMTWITLNITNETNNDTFLEMFTIEWLEVGQGVTNSTDWVPGYSALYTVNVTYSNDGLNANASMYYDEFDVTIEDVSAYSYILEYTPTVNETTGWTGNATVDVTNDGNIAETFTFHFWVIDDADIIVHDSEMTSSLLSTGLSEVLTYNYMGLIAGAYTLNVTEPDGSNVSSNIVVEEQNNPPLLADLTELATTIYVGDVLTFAVNYTDANDDVPAYLKCYIDATWNATSEMFEDSLANFTLVETNATDLDHTDAKMFSGTWTAILGLDYTYAFVTSDGMEVTKLEPVGNDFDVLEALPTFGTISGKVNNTASENITNATVVIYMTTTTTTGEGNNTTTVTTIDYFNTTTDEFGDYESEELDFGEYTIYVTKTGYANSAEYDFELNVTDNVEEKDFSLTPITTGILSGMVTSGTGNDTVNIANATVVIYKVVKENISGNMTDVNFFLSEDGKWFKDMTNASYESILTDEDGTYSETLAFGTYMVYAMADGYDDAAEMNVVLDLAHQAVTKDFSLVESGPVTYDVNVGPIMNGDGIAVVGATVTFQLNLTRALTNYTATTNATGYATFTLPVAAIPVDTEITATKGTDTITWKQGASIPKLGAATPTTYDKTYGPWTDFVGWELSFVINNVTHKGTVNATGYVTIALPNDVTVPVGHDFVLKKDGEEVMFKEGETPEKKAVVVDDDDSSLLWLWIVIIIVVIIIIIVVVMMKKKPVEAPLDLEEEEMEEGLGEDYDEDMDEMDEEEDFGEFEGEMDDEEMEGVDDLADELEEFDEEEDFEEEDLGDYEEDIDDEFDDDDIDDEDFDDEDFDDDEFDDDF